MKLAFSTLGCPGWSWNEIYATAKDLGMSGIEVRGVGRELYAPKAKPFLPESIETTKKQLVGLNVAICMLTSGATLGIGDTAASMAEAKAYIDLAALLGVPYVRVMIAPHPEPVEGEDIAKCGMLYGQLCAYAAPKGVTPLLETNGELAQSEVMAELMRTVPQENKGVLWDIHHPYRFFEEQPAETYANIGQWVKYVHVKDSIGDAANVQYRMMGYGDVPVLDTLKLLQENQYDGFITLEWVKRWNPDLQEPGIVFSHFADYMRCLFNQL